MAALIWPLIASFLIALALLPAIRCRAHQIDLLDVPDAVRHCHAKAVPRLGGLAILFAYLSGLGVPALLDPAAMSTRVTDVATCAVLVFAAGLFDDWQGLPAGVKLAVILIAATLVAASPGLSRADLPSMVLSAAGITAVTIAFNLIDGVDGLAAAMGLATAGVLVAASEDATRAASLLPLIGALAAFLRFNWTPATLFLGDGGSLTVGFLLAAHGWMLARDGMAPDGNPWIAATVPALLFVIPLLDLAWAIGRRKLQGRPVFAADRGHLHHRLLDRGWGAGRIALTLPAASALCGVLAIATQRGSVLAGLALAGVLGIGEFSVLVLALNESFREVKIKCHLRLNLPVVAAANGRFRPRVWAVRPGDD